MSTYHLNIKNGKIVVPDYDNPKEVIERTPSTTSTDGYTTYTRTVYPDKYLTSIDVTGNWKQPWHVEIKHNRIFCTCEAEYSDGIHRKKRVFPLADGRLGLSGGNIDSRYAYFRTAEFQNWLNEMGLTAVQLLESSDFTYTGHNAYCGAGTASYYIATDGERVGEPELVREASWLKDYDGICCDDSEYRHTFKNCTWVIVKESCHYRNSHNSASILYVPKGVNPMDLTEQIKSHAPTCSSGIWDKCREPSEEEKEAAELARIKNLYYSVEAYVVDHWYARTCDYRAYFLYEKLVDRFTSDGSVDTLANLIREKLPYLYKYGEKINPKSHWYKIIENKLLPFMDGSCPCRKLVDEMKGVSYASMSEHRCSTPCDGFRCRKQED